MSGSKEIYFVLKNDPMAPEFNHDIVCPLCLSVSEVMKAGRDCLTFAHKQGDSFFLDRWYCGSCDRHFYTEYKDTD